MLGEMHLERYLDRLNWIICGCESGQNARGTNIFWADSLREQCNRYEIPFFLKQLRGGGKIVKMPELGGRIWDQYPVEKK